MNRRALNSLGALVAGVCPCIAWGQQAGAGAQEMPLEEIVVTATKRVLSVQDVPLAVSALNGQLLERNDVSGLGALTNIDPSFQVQSRGPGDSQIIIRGIQSAGASLVSVYVDEAVVTGSDFNGNGGRQSSLQLYDVERVEILKGPQGTLFGSGSMAGSLRIIANKPVLDEYSFKATTSVEAGSGVNTLSEVHAVANVPLVEDELGLRFTAWNTDGGGYLDRVDEPRPSENTNDQHIKGARGIAAWQPNSSFKLTLTAVSQDLDLDDLNYFRRNSGDYVVGAPSWGRWDEANHLYSAVGEYQLAFGSITAASSYSQREILWSDDTTPIAALLGLPGAYQINEYQDRSIWSSELRFSSDFAGPLQLVGGVFYEVDKDEAQNMIGAAVPGTGNTACVLYADCVAAGRAADVISSRALQHDVDQRALFLQGDLELTDQLTFTAGVRFYRATLDWSELQLQGLRFSPSSPVQHSPVVTLDEQVDQENTSYNFSLGWRPLSDLSLYVRAASGFRLGGINALTVRQIDPGVPLGYESDKLWNYEIGAKAAFFDRRLLLDGAIYYIDWSGQQVSAPSSAGVFFYIDNVGTSSVEGAELQLTYRPIDGLTARAGVTYTDSRLTQDQPGVAVNDPAAGRDGDRVPLVPKWAATGQVRYEFPVASSMMYVQASANYRGTAYTAFHPGAGFVPLESYWRADASVGIETGRWDVSLFAKNLTDEVAQIGVVPLTGIVSAGDAAITTVRPRTFGIKVSFGF